jgi:Fur family ferric uptake transcriptional regulator
MKIDDLRQTLRHGRHRVTRPRLAVWRALLDADTHLTADELAERVNAHGPGVNLASVYRSLALFEELELVRESRLSGDDASRWELAGPIRSM